VRGDNPARERYLRWGWQRVGSIKPFPDSPRFETLVKGVAPDTIGSAGTVAAGALSGRGRRRITIEER